MWPHTVIAALGLWLALSPLIFDVDPSRPLLWFHEIGVGVLVMALAGFSAFRKLDILRGATALVALYLLVRAYFLYPHPRPPLEQNHFVVGILILMFVILPRWANLPPEVRTSER